MMDGATGTALADHRAFVELRNASRGADDDPGLRAGAPWPFNLPVSEIDLADTIYRLTERGLPHGRIAEKCGLSLERTQKLDCAGWIWARARVQAEVARRESARVGATPYPLLARAS